MARVIRDIWVMDKHGTVLFNRVYKEKLDPQLFGGFMSALNTFSGQLDEGGLSNFEIGDKKFIISKKNDLIFVANFNRGIKPKKASQELENIMNKFLMKYTVDLVAWDGNTSRFKDFEKEIKDSLETVVDNLQKSFW